MILKQHPLSAIFPAMPDSEYIELKAHISEHGQQSAIAIFEGLILDGWHRYRACGELSLTPKTRELPKCTDALSFVLGQNLRRRHLSESQRAMVAAKIAKLQHGGDRKNGAKNQGANLPLDPPPTVSEAAKTLSVSPRSVKDAKVVLGDKKQAAKVMAGEKTVSAAAREIRAKKEEQKEVHRDATGYAIPEKLLALWNRRQEVKDVQNEIAAAIRKVKAAHEKPDPLWKPVNMQAVEIALHNCKRDLDMAMPYAVCATCQGRSTESCTSCKGRGFLSKHIFDTCVPEELKAIRAKSCL